LFPKKATGSSFTYVSSESTDKTKSAPTFAQETLTARTYALWLSSSEEFLEDSVGDVGAYFGAIIAKAWASKFDNEFLVGGGTPVTGLLKDADTSKHTMTGTGFTDATFVAIGNPANLLWGQRLNLEINFFLDTYYGMKSDQVFWRARVRAALNIALPKNYAALRTAATQFGFP
jgi:hypothetical protein